MAEGTSQRIHKLPDSLINKIAAGEVIERPASVIKELLENSLDAGANRINIDIRNGGSRLIRVEDNGYGIHPDDLLLAVDRHTTSKIHNDADLWQIRTLGFRGEALSSIASVSRFTLTTKQNGSEHGWSVNFYDKNSVPVMQPAAHHSGTTVEVQDLFHNTPARRKFLRSERTEFIHIHEFVKRIALSRFDLSIRLAHNGRQVMQVTDDALHPSERVAMIMGRHFQAHSLMLDEQNSGMKLYGWLGGPDIARSQTDLQFFYLNGRVVRDKLLNHAVRLAFQDKLYAGRYPVYLLYLDVDPAAVDINVHPAKQEARFRDTRNVHDFVFGTLQRVLNKQSQTGIYINRQKNSDHLRGPDIHYRISEPASGIKGNSDHVDVSAISIGGRYIIMAEPGGFTLIDVRRARESIVKHRLEQEFSQGRIHSRPVLVPLTCQVNNNEAALIEDNQTLLEKAGLLIQRISPTGLLIREIPQALAGANAVALISTILSVLKQNDKTEEQLTYLPEAMAGHANDGATDQLSNKEINSLLFDLEKIKSRLIQNEYKTVFRHLDMQLLQELLNG